VVFIKIVHGYHGITHSNQAIYSYTFNYFSLSYHLQVSIGSSRVVIQDYRTYIQNIIDHTLKVNYIAKNINT